MKKFLFVLLIVVGIILLYGWMTYNNLVTRQENVTQAWSQVENVYQRRADLVPNLVSVVKNYAEYEQGTLIAVTEARAKKAASSSVRMENYSESDLKDFQAAQDELGESLNRIIVTVENYPDLKANENYLTLQAELAGCENRIQTERERFNEAAKAYNASLRRFPTNMIAKMFGFEKRPYFEADAGADKVPETF